MNVLYRCYITAHFNCGMFKRMRMNVSLLKFRAWLMVHMAKIMQTSLPQRRL